MYLPQPETKRGVKSSFSLKEMGEWAATGAGIGAGIGLIGGAVALPAAISGALEGGLAYVTGWACGRLAATLGLDENWQAFAEVVGATISPGGEVLNLVGKAPKMSKLIMRTFTDLAGTAGAAYLGWSMDDEDPRRGMLVGALGGALLVSSGRFFDLEGLVKRHGAQIAKRMNELPGLRHIREIPEIYVGKEAVGLREAIEDGMRTAFAKHAEAQELLRKIAGAGVDVDSEVARALGSLKYGVKVSLLDELKKKMPEIGEFLDDYIKIMTDDAKFMADKGLLDLGTLEAFTYIKKSQDYLKVHIPIVPRMGEELEGMEKIIRKKPRGILRAQPILKEAGIQRPISKKLLQQLKEQTGIKSLKELAPGTKLKIKRKSGKVDEWTVIRKGNKKYLMRHYTPEEYKKITEGYIKQGVWPEGTILEPNLVAGAIKYASERGQLYKRAYTLDKIEQALTEHGLLGTAKTSALSVKIPEIRLNDSWGIKAFGRLSGKWTTPEVAQALENLNELFNYSPSNIATGILGEFTRRWASMTNFGKKWFLGLHFKSYINQALGDIALFLVNGHNPSTVLRKGLEALSDKEFKAAFERLGGGSVGIEHDTIAKGYDYVSGKLLKRDKVKGALAALDAIGDKLIGAFGYTDKVFRAGLVRHFMDEGLKMEDAMKKAFEVMPTYDLLPAGVKTLRDTIWPFISFSYATLPKIVTAAARNPANFLLLLTFAEAIQVAGFQEMYGSHWREGRKFEKLVNEHYMQPQIGGFFADYIRIPKLGNVPGGYMSISWLPWNLPVSLPAVTEASRPTFWGATMLLQHPVIKTAFGLLMNLDPASGRTVFDYAGPGRTWESIVQWYAKNLLPAPPGTGKWAMQYFAREGWLQPVTSWFNYFGVDFAGKPYELEHLLWNNILPTVKRYDPSYKAAMEWLRIRHSIEEHKRGLMKLVYRGADRETLVKRMEELGEYEKEQFEKAKEIGAAMKLLR